MNSVLIVGATSGIGQELARQYARKGWKVGATGRRAEPLNELKSQFPAQIFTSIHDVTATDSLSKIEKLAAEMGGFEVFIYNSGVGIYNRELAFEIEDKTIQTNVRGFVECAGWAYNFFKKQPTGGTLVGISSVASQMGSSKAPAYSASKAFMANYLDGLWARAARYDKKVAVVDIRPGYVTTAMTEQNKGMFWVSSVETACRQIISSIENREKVAYVTRRWRLAAWVMRNLPGAMKRML